MRWIALFVLAAMLLPACGESSKEKAARLLTEGEALVKTEPDKAIEVLTASIEEQASAGAYLARAKVKLAKAPTVMPGTIPPDVAPDLAKALELEPKNTSALFFKARLLGIGRRVGRDILEMILTIPVAKDDGVGLFIRARSEAKLAGDLPGRERPDMLKRAVADFEKAERVLKQCVKLDPSGKYGRQAQALLDEM